MFNLVVGSLLLIIFIYAVASFWVKLFLNGK